MLIAVIAALFSAACFASSSVLQHSAAQLAPTAESLRPSLLIDLLHRRRWLWGLAASALGFGSQSLAFHFGCLVLVQPLILFELLFALPLAARLARRTVQPRQWLSAVMIAGGLGLFLTVARPHDGRPSVPLLTWVVLAGGVGLSVGLCLAVAHFASSLLKTTLLATAAGVTFGLLAALLDSVTYLLAHRGLAGTHTTWQPYVLALVVPTGEVFAQSAYQAGPISASLPAIYVFEPGSAIAIGIGAFGERVTHAPAAIGAEVVALIGVVAGVVTLAHATPLLRPECRRASFRDPGILTGRAASRK